MTKLANSIMASLIAMLVIGGVLFISWAVWDGFYAQYPIIPRRVLNQTFVSPPLRCQGPADR
jgi:hypothetical protein